MKCIFTALFILCFTFNGIAGINTWTQCSGTDGNAIGALLIDTTTTGRIYATAYGILRSEDFGTTWIFSSDSLFQSVPLSIAVNPKAPNEVYAYQYFGLGILKSTTYGYGNWTSITNDLSDAVAVPNLLFDPENVGRMYAASEPYGLPVYYSDDTGYTWTPSYSGISTDEASSYLIMHPTQHNILYIAADATPGIYVSYNATTTWQSLPLYMPVQSLTIDPTDTNKIYAGGDPGFASSFDAGSTWSISTDTSISNYEVNAVVVNPLNPMIIYVGTQDNSVFKSEDRGNTWSSMSTNLPFQKVISLAYDTITRTLFVGDTGEVTSPTGIWMYQDTDLDLAVEDWEKYDFEILRP